MDSFNQPGLWDLSLPPSLPALADDDFIALLQKQFGINHGFPIPMNDMLSKDNNGFANGVSAPPQTTNIDPQSLSRVPLPRPAAADSPPSDDSSPSPSNANEASGSRSRRQSTIYGIDDDDHDDDPSLKRKASEEDLDNEPTHKSQHTSSAAATKKSSRRKSTGNPSADENRLQKRKEQNRAAQRAFRERKEKHVKDLEDQVAELEERNAVTVQENQSLKEVVTRLQSENMRLRQSSFTFAVPSSQATNINAGSSSSGAQNQQMGSFNSPPSTTTSSTASTHDSPQSIFANDKDMDSTSDPLAFLNGNLSMLTSMDASGNGSEHTPQTATADAMNMDFGFGPVNTATPYTTIASNPLFMSFREPDAFDPMSAHQNRDRSTSTASSSTKPVTPFDFTSPHSSSPHVPQTTSNNSNGSNNNTSSWQDISMSDMHAFDLTLTNTLDELFGNVYGSNSASQAASSPNSGGYDFLTGFNSINGLGKPSPNSSGSTVSLSPISHHVSPPLSNAASSPGLSNLSACDMKKKCTKDDMRRFVAADSGSVFAPSGLSSGSPNPSNASNSPALSTMGSGASPEALKDCGDDDCNEFPRCKGLQLPKTQKSEKNMEVMNAWRKIRTDPNFKDIDINELCSEFASKAKCDGCQVVIEPEGMKEILESVARQRQKKQRSELFKTSEMVLAGADQMGLEATSN